MDRINADDRCSRCQNGGKNNQSWRNRHEHPQEKHKDAEQAIEHKRCLGNTDDPVANKSRNIIAGKYDGKGCSCHNYHHNRSRCASSINKCFGYVFPL